MAKIVRDNIYLFEKQAKDIAELVDNGMNKQWFYRKYIERGIEEQKNEAKKIANHSKQ